MAGRVRDRARPVRHTELVEDRRQVVLDRLLADAEGLRDLAIPGTGGDEGKHIELARAERIRRQVFDRGGLPHGVDDPLEEIGAAIELIQKQVLAVGGPPDRGDQLGRLGRLGDVCDRSHFCGPDDARIVVITTHDHHRGLGRALVELSRRLSRVELRKVRVDQHDVRGGLVHDRDRVCSGC